MYDYQGLLITGSFSIMLRIEGKREERKKKGRACFHGKISVRPLSMTL